MPHYSIERGAIPPVPHTSAKCGAVLIINRDKFTLTMLRAMLSAPFALCLVGNISILKMEGVCASETMVYFYQTGRCRIQQYHCPQSLRRVNIVNCCLISSDAL
jgi:hypothetical protein